MSTTYADHPATAPNPSPRKQSLRRIVGLTKANSLLMVRNRVTLAYAIALPLFPMLFLLIGDSSSLAAQLTIPSVLMLAWLFPVFYNLLSMVVTRRDELVLKRLRTGEARDVEVLASMAIPGFIVTLITVGLAAVLAAALGAPLPTNPALLVAVTLLGCITLAGLALWTAAWTRTAEAAQLTSMPVMLLTALGTVVFSLPPAMQDVARFTPGAALDELVRISWLGTPYHADAPLSFADTWQAAALPLAVALAWAVASIAIGWRTMRWEPRA